jgi:hypothetical protein
MGFERDSFLAESWKSAAENQTGVVRQEKQDKTNEVPVQSYLRVQELAEQNEEFGKAFGVFNLGDHALRYAERIAKLERARFEGWDKRDIESADRGRRMAHNSLVDAVNFLGRKANSLDLDMSWRRAIGTHRDKVGEWGCAVAEFLCQKVEKEVHETDS